RRNDADGRDVRRSARHRLGVRANFEIVYEHTARGVHAAPTIRRAVRSRGGGRRCRRAVWLSGRGVGRRATSARRMVDATELVRRLGILATALGVTAAVAGSPYAHRGRIDIDDLSRAVVHEDDHVSAVELAGWIRARRPRLRIVDIRDQADFDAYHVPT